MLAPGIRAAAAEQQRRRDPSCSVPVARGPAERRETTRPAGKVRPRSARAAPRDRWCYLWGLGGSLRPGHPDRGVRDPDSESGRAAGLMCAPVPLLLLRSPLLADTWIAWGWHCVWVRACVGARFGALCTERGGFPLA